MNNAKLVESFLSLEQPSVDKSEREAQLMRLIDAVRTVRESPSWRSLKKEVFDKLPDGLNRQINQEARKESPSIGRLNQLSGELKWAERYADLEKLEHMFRVELEGIRSQLHG